MAVQVFRDGITADRVMEAMQTDGQVSLHIIESPDSVKVLSDSGRYWELIQAAVKVEKDRQSRYRDYDLMEDDSTIASALELVVDDATQYSAEANATVWVEGKHPFKTDIEQFLSSIDFENKIWGWTYNIAKYGDFFLGVDAKEGEGVVNLRGNEHPKTIYRVDIDGKLSGFVRVSSEGKMRPDPKEPYEYVHFINNYRPNFENAEIEVVEIDIKDETRTQKRVKKRITSMYGTAILQNARRIYKVLNLLEVSLALARLARSPLIRVFYVNTEGMTPDERKETIKDLEEKYKKKKSIDIDKNWYEQQYSPLGNTDEMFIPYTGQKGDIRAETIGGEVNIKDIADIEYIRNKLFAALRIPKQYLGFEEAVPGGLGAGSTLTKLDIRYARMVKKVQRALIEGLYRLLQIHLSFKFKQNISIEDLHLSMVPVSSAEEDARMEYLEKKVGIATTMIAFLGSMEGQLDPKYLAKYIFKYIINLPELDADQLVLGAPIPTGAPPEVERLIHKINLLSESECKPSDILCVLKEYAEGLQKAAAAHKSASDRKLNRDLKAPTLSGGQDEQRKFRRFRYNV